MPKENKVLNGVTTAKQSPASTLLLSSNVVEVEAQGIKTTSLIIAEYFGKRHDNVIRDIENLEIPESWRLLNFEETVISRPNPSGGADIGSTAYTLTRDGFAILAMGFTGKEAMAWKLKFLAAFNAMEAELKRLHAEQQAALTLANKQLKSANYEIADRNEYLESKKAMVKDDHLMWQIVAAVQIEAEARRSLESKDLNQPCSDPTSRPEKAARSKFIRARVAAVKRHVKGIESIFKGTEQGDNLALQMYLDAVQSEIEPFSRW